VSRCVTYFSHNLLILSFRSSATSIALFLLDENFSKIPELKDSVLELVLPVEFRKNSVHLGGLYISTSSFLNLLDGISICSGTSALLV